MGTKIDADTDLLTVRTDVMSILILIVSIALIMAQTNILTACDRIQDITAYMNTLTDKLQKKYLRHNRKEKTFLLLRHPSTI